MGACVSGHTQITDVNRIETKISNSSEHVAVIESSLMRRSEDRVNQYKILNCIGSGFQSKVFRVENTKIRKTRHTNTKRMYAMKMLKVEKIEKVAKKDSSCERSRFLSYVRLYARPQSTPIRLPEST